MRGDNAEVASAMFYAAGSPPRAWGQLDKDENAKPLHRITPTCVGTTLVPGVFQPVGEDHPHVRGDNSVRGLPASLYGGSPPRAWGQLIQFQHQSSLFPDHPHVRGDNEATVSPRPQRLGSPPRAWGQLFIPHHLSWPLRITPTCVGTTS